MTTDAWLAIAHHLAVFGLLGVLAVEWGLVRAGMTASDVVARARRFIGLQLAVFPAIPVAAALMARGIGA